MFCSRRGGSTWLANILASHPGVRYVGRTLSALQQSRWRSRVPSLKQAARHSDGHEFDFVAGFEGEAEQQFKRLMDDVISGKLTLNPTLAVRSPFFQRRTERIVFQITSGTPLVGWFGENFNVSIAVLFRHPIPTAMSIMRSGWPPECEDLLLHQPFCEAHLTGEQIDLARKVLRDSNGEGLAAHVLDWSLKMLVPYREIQSERHPEWAFVAYEQLVSDRRKTIEYVAHRLNLTDVDAMDRQGASPSRSASPATVPKVQDANYLLARWCERLNPTETDALMKIPREFGIELYDSGVAPQPGVLKQ